eukprot:747752-Hanusia_phi.AAC.3
MYQILAPYPPRGPPVQWHCDGAAGDAPSPFPSLFLPDDEPADIYLLLHAMCCFMGILVELLSRHGVIEGGRCDVLKL